MILIKTKAALAFMLLKQPTVANMDYR